MSRKLAAAICAAAAVVCSAADPNFTGTWKLDTESSDTRALPGQPARTLRIEHEGITVRCRELDPAGAQWSFTTDRKETRTKTGGAVLSSIAKWEGDAALVNVLASGPGINYTQMDRWRVSRDGTQLTIKREVTRMGRTVEGLLVYAREDTGALAKSDDPAAPGFAHRASGPAPTPGETNPAAAAIAPYRVDKGTRIPLTFINSVSTKGASEGDRIYLMTAFPIVGRGRIIIPPGSYVAGTLTEVKRPGRMHGRGEIYIRFDSLTLPNGVTRDFRARPDAADGTLEGELDRAEGKIKSEGNKGGDARTVGEAAATGASVGVIAGSAAGRAGMGAAVGGLAGAAAGVMGVLLSRGPDVVLAKGTTIEMVLDRTLVYTDAELKPAR